MSTGVPGPSELRLALVSREYPPFFGGGIGTYARWIVPALAAAGVRVHVITEVRDEACPRVELHGNVTVHRVRHSMGRGGWTSSAARFAINAGRRVIELAGRGEIDVAEFAECEGAAAAMLLMRGVGAPIPTIVHLHTPSELLFELRSLSVRALDSALGAYFEGERLAIRLADRVGAPSRFIALWAREHYALTELPAVIPYAIGPLCDAPAPAREKNVLYVGRIEPRKGVESLVLAWRQVVRRHPHARLRLAGADTAGAPDGRSLKAFLLSQLSESERATVQFTGRLRPEDLTDEYAWASVCVVPSLWENFPNTCIEALTHARPVVVSDNGGMAEMIEGTNAGEVFAAGEPESLAGALIAMLSESPEALAERGRAGRARISRMCDPIAVARARIDLYRDTISRCRERAGGPRAGVLAEWNRCEDLLRGDVSTMAMPPLGGAIARWIAPARTLDGATA